MTSAPTLRVRVGLPHYFQETDSTRGYGSSRRDTRLRRTLALARCLYSLVALSRRPQDITPLIETESLQATPELRQGSRLLPPLELQIHVFTDGQHLLNDVLAEIGRPFRDQITVHQLALPDSRQLALACRDQLIRAEPLVDLTLYSEDDLVINDPLFFDKQLWFLSASKGKAVLMPHRYELIPGSGGQRLLPDGPLRPDFIERFCKPQTGVASGEFFKGQPVSFDRTQNPHSGMFCLNAKQVQLLRNQPLANEGFIGPLETAATLTVLQYFPVLKPSLADRNFLWVEHGHPSYLEYAQTWPLNP